ncbi:phosphopantetheine-binding protein [Amycolatopsis sp. NPDC049159]|uniref:phosphopantetheine-binding protein n=1 Tax=unclassified Amycolatopsis TaxID=2618356 RepID=UPI0033C7E28E
MPQDPRHELEATVARIWQDVLDVPSVGTGDHFFKLGGHSLQAMTVIVRVRNEIGGRVGLADILRAPVLGEFVELVSTRTNHSSGVAVEEAP